MSQSSFNKKSSQIQHQSECKSINTENIEGHKLFDPINTNNGKISLKADLLEKCPIDHAKSQGELQQQNINEEKTVKGQADHFEAKKIFLGEFQRIKFFDCDTDSFIKSSFLDCM